MKVYIAGPLFNKKQVENLERIEKLFDGLDIEYYSPRLHSGSDKLSAEEKRDFHNWTSVFESNLTGLAWCTHVLAVLNYPMPEGKALAITNLPDGSHVGDTQYETLVDTLIELPDSGTVFEMGYASANEIPIIGFHPDETPKRLNLMLSHSCEFLAIGFDKLETLVNACDIGVDILDHEYLHEFIPASIFGGDGVV